MFRGSYCSVVPYNVRTGGQAGICVFDTPWAAVSNKFGFIYELL
jgi:hypothetical protein